MYLLRSSSFRHIEGKVCLLFQTPQDKSHTCHLLKPDPLSRYICQQNQSLPLWYMKHKYLSLSLDRTRGQAHLC